MGFAGLARQMDLACPQNLFTFFHSQAQPILYSGQWQWQWFICLLQDQSTKIIVQDWLNRDFNPLIQGANVVEMQGFSFGDAFVSKWFFLRHGFHSPS